MGNEPDGWADGRTAGRPGCNEIDALDDARSAEQHLGGAAGKGVLLDGKSARRELALQPFPYLSVIAGPHEPRDRELAQERRVVSHRELAP